MQSVFQIFQILKEQSVDNSDGGIAVGSIPLIEHHKIGVSANGQPVFFIKCEESAKANFLDSSLEFIAVQFNRECQLLNSQQNIEKGIYTVIYLKTDSIDFQAYFLEVILLVIKKLPTIPTLQELKIEVEKLIELFSKFSKPPTKTVQGLWGELFVIAQSKNPAYLIQAWHNSAADKFDFNDGIDKIEVKSTSKTKRIHHFSIEQLSPNPNSDLIIISVFVVETGVGESIFDLVKQIDDRIQDDDLSFRMNQVIVQTLGREVSKSFDMYFDFHLALDSIQFYESEDIPSIAIQNVPNEVINIHFDTDLTTVNSIKKIKTKSILHKSLF